MDDLEYIEDGALDQERIAAVLEAVARQDTAAVDALLEPLHAADIADLLEQIGPGERRACLCCGRTRSTARSCRKSRTRSGKR